MRYHVDEDTCIGCGLCAETCPAVFFLRKDGLAEAKPGAVPEEEESAAEAAKDGCPTGAIAKNS